MIADSNYYPGCAENPWPVYGDDDYDPASLPKCSACEETIKDDEPQWGCCDIDDDGHKGFCPACKKEHDRECSQATYNIDRERRFSEWKEGDRLESFRE
jgi:hypothetical protein